MTSSITELRLSMARADEVFVTEDALTAELEDGRTISVPIVWYPRLSYATQKERENWCMIGKGSGIHWPDLDEHISIENMLVGSPSGESQKSLKRWLDGRENANELETSSTLGAIVEAPLSLGDEMKDYIAPQRKPNFWSLIYELRKEGLIPRIWTRGDLRPYLQKPQGPFERSTINTNPSNQSVSLDGAELGKQVQYGQKPMAWRIGYTGSGEYQLICDPDDDLATQRTEMHRANELVRR